MCQEAKAHARLRVGKVLASVIFKDCAGVLEIPPTHTQILGYRSLFWKALTGFWSASLCIWAVVKIMVPFWRP